MLLDILGVGLLENLLVGKGACKDVTDAGNGANQQVNILANMQMLLNFLIWI